MFSKLFSSALLVASALQGMVAANPVSLVPRDVGPVGGQVSVDGAGVYMRATRLHDGSILGGRQHDLTLGANWYLTSHFKFQANYVKVDASRRGVHSTPEIFELRAQMHF